MEGEAQVAVAVEAGASALVVVAAGLRRDVTRLHGQSLDWMSDIPAERFTTLGPPGYVFPTVVSHSTLCLLKRCLAENL